MDTPIAYDPELLDRLRDRLALDGLDAFLVPHADAHQSEYLPACTERLARLTGFTGSAGFAIVLRDKAAVFVDGRYTLQAADQVDAEVFEIVALAQCRPAQWLEQNLSTGMVVGFDAWLHTPDGLEPYAKACRNQGAELSAVATNPIDAEWADRPAPPSGPLQALDRAFITLSSAAKRERIADDLKNRKIDAAVLNLGDSIAWLFNIRAQDVPFTPLVLGFAILHADGRAQVFVDPERADDTVRAHLGSDVEIRDPVTLSAALEHLGREDARVLVDGATMATKIVTDLSDAGATVVNGADPCIRPKACKTPAEIEGIKRAHLRDGAALTRFLAWLERTAPQGGVTELSAAAHLDALRGDNDLFRGPSFPTISGSGPNGAIVHYRVTPDSDRELKPGELYLVDSGGQYLDGTTDVTRTVAIGKPSAEMKDRFTRVLKGHIAIATQVFPKGTHGEELDVLARRALWEAGLDYEHGTGHGVGTYLGVHEGPQRIARRGPGAELDVGMVLSNEPGYYKTGGYGIRIENLITVQAAPRPKGAERDILAFETLTLAPIDLNLVNPDLMNDDEIAWLDAYHARVREALAPHLDGETRAWLEAATRPLTPSR